MVSESPQVQQCDDSDHWHNRLYMRDSRSAASDGDLECILTCLEASLGGVPEQVL